MTDPDLVLKKLTLVEARVQLLRTRARPTHLASDVE
jgi:hypothetical protein